MYNSKLTDPGPWEDCDHGRPLRQPRPPYISLALGAGVGNGLVHAGMDVWSRKFPSKRSTK